MEGAKIHLPGEEEEHKISYEINSYGRGIISIDEKCIKAIQKLKNHEGDFKHRNGIPLATEKYNLTIFFSEPIDLKDPQRIPILYESE